MVRCYTSISDGVIFSFFRNLSLSIFRMSPWCTHVCKDGMFCLLDASLILQKVDAVFPFVAKALQMCIHFCFLEFGCKCIRANFLQARQWSSLNFENVKEKSFFIRLSPKNVPTKKNYECQIWENSWKQRDKWKVIWCHILLQQKGVSNIEIKHYHENGVEARGAGLVTEVTFWASSSAHQ